MITLRPVGGLCNRLMAIDSMIRVCESVKRDLRIIWLINEDVGISFHDIYKPLKSEAINITLVELSDRPLIYSDRLSGGLRQSVYNTLLKLLQRYKFSFVKHARETARLKASNYNFHQLKTYPSAYLSSWGKLDSLPFDSSRFLLQVAISKKIQTFKANTIGVHIRRTDHTLAIQKSPLENFINKMKEELEANTKLSFFVASDSADVKTTLLEKFGDKIFISDKENASRNSQSGMINAVLDLYGLANTSKIIGSSISTFTAMASEIRGIELIDITK